MLRCNIGIEHGNAEYRKKYLRRNVSDEVQIKAFEFMADKKYKAVANCIIGMPDENRELIFDTIRFVRKLPKKILMLLEHMYSLLTMELLLEI